MRLQDSLLSRCPLSQANTTLRPSDKAPMITSNAARSFAIPAFTYKPSAHWYTTSRPDRSCWTHSSYSNCQVDFSRWIDARDNGAPAPSSPRMACSKSPVARPWR